MSNWNDDRLDRRDEEVKAGFARLEGQIKDGFAETDTRFARLESQIEVNRQETNKRFVEMRSETNKRLAEVSSEMHRGFSEMNSAYATSNRTLLLVAGGIIAALIGVIGALVVALAA